MPQSAIVLDESLLRSCMTLTGIRDQGELINFALRELLQRHKNKSLLNLQGEINWNDKFYSVPKHNKNASR